MQQSITVVLQGARPVGAFGEIMHDADEGTLVVAGEPGTYLCFNLDHVLYYAVTPKEEPGD